MQRKRKGSAAAAHSKPTAAAPGKQTPAAASPTPPPAGPASAAGPDPAADVASAAGLTSAAAAERLRIVVFGPASSIFDFVTFGLLLLVLGLNEESFHTGWFVESLFSQILVVLVIRTRLSPFWLSRPSRPLAIAIAGALAAAVLIPLSPLGPILGLTPLPLVFWPLLAAIVAAYLTLVEVLKRLVERTTRPGPRPAVLPSPGPGRGDVHAGSS